MPATIPNLWPHDFGQEEKLAPVAILRQQGAALGELTQNIIVGRVVTSGNPSGFLHQFLLFCSALGGYQIEIFRVPYNMIKAELYYTNFWPSQTLIYTSPPLKYENQAK